VLLSIGVLLLCAAAFAGYQARDRSAHLGTTHGEIVSARNCGKGHRCIVVRYATAGSVHVVEAKVRRASLQRGPQMVVYDRRDPRLAWVGGPEAVWHVFQGLSALGGLLVVASGVSALRRHWLAHRTARALSADQHR
jgi:hypothetical protein